MGCVCTPYMQNTDQFSVAGLRCRQQEDAIASTPGMRHEKLRAREEVYEMQQERKETRPSSLTRIALQHTKRESCFARDVSLLAVRLSPWSPAFSLFFQVLRTFFPP